MKKRNRHFSHFTAIVFGWLLLAALPTYAAQRKAIALKKPVAKGALSIFFDVLPNCPSSAPLCPFVHHTAQLAICKKSTSKRKGKFHLVMASTLNQGTAAEISMIAVGKYKLVTYGIAPSSDNDNTFVADPCNTTPPTTFPTCPDLKVSVVRHRVTMVQDVCDSGLR